MNKVLFSALVAAIPVLQGCGSAIHSAALRGQTEIVRRELDRGVPVDGRYGGYTALMAAASSGNPETVKLLLDRGADKTLRSKMTNKTPYDWTFVRLRTSPTDSHLRQVMALLGDGGRSEEKFSAEPPPTIGSPGLVSMNPTRAAEAAAPRRGPGNLDDAAYGRMRASAGLPPETKEVFSEVDLPKGRAEERPDDFALVIGVEDYQSIPRADYGMRDAVAVRRHLEARGYPARNIVHLAGSQATGNKLKSYLEEWLPLNVKPTSTLFVYYSGHGAPDPKTGEAYLLPWDGDPSFLKSTALPVKKLYADLAKIKAKRVIVALDACFSGAGGRSVLAQGARPLVTKTEDLRPAGAITVLAAASGDEITGALNEQGHGMFTYFLLKGLAAGKGSAKELMEYLSPKVQDEARRQNRQQTPTLIGEDAPL